MMNKDTSKTFTGTDRKSGKQQWAPIWSGLVADQQAKHYQQMKNAIWLFLYLVLNANRKSGFLIRKVRTISFDMGIKKDTVLRWLSILRKAEYIATRSTGRCLLIQVRKWKTLPPVQKPPYQRPQMSNCTVSRNPTSPEAMYCQNPVHLDRKRPDFGRPNNNILTKIY